MLGLYVSDHPLLGVEWAVRKRADATIADLKERDEGTQVTVGGVVTAIQRKFTKSGEPITIFVLEDLQAAVEVTAFAKATREVGHKLVEDAVAVVKGRVEVRDDTRRLRCFDVEVLEGLSDTVQPLTIRIPAESLSPPRIELLKRVLSEHPGASPVVLQLAKDKRVRLHDSFAVDPTSIAGAIRVHFGHEAVVF
jgi:DNA polymerase-3 subunit alpha